MTDTKKINTSTKKSTNKSEKNTNENTTELLDKNAQKNTDENSEKNVKKSTTKSTTKRVTKKQKEKAILVCKLLDYEYPGLDKCYLNFTKDYELLFATILSAQCTDDMVNKVTDKLFSEFTCLEDYANADITEIERLIKSTGFYKNKAQHLKKSAIMLIENYDGIVPSDVEELTKLSGVGRKTANVVRSHIFKLDSIVVDTHVKRFSKKVGLTKESDPVKVEFDLMRVLPQEHWIKYNQQVIAHGRKVCKAPTPKCSECVFFDICVTRS